MRVLVLGCGEMAKVAIRDLVEHPVFQHVTIATRRVPAAEDFLATFPHGTVRLRVVGVDVQQQETLAALMHQHDVTCNLAGPNYLNAVPVARAAIAAGRPLVDVSDDFAASLDLFGLDSAARAAGVTIVMGLGASPGVTNILARHGADQLDRVEEIRTSWIMRGSDMGGPALIRHLLFSNTHRAFVFEDGAMREVRPFEDGRETIEYPVLGPVEVAHIGHPEPFMLARSFPSLRYADDKATFLPTQVNSLLMELGRVARSGRPVPVGGRLIDPMDFAASYVLEHCRRLEGVSPIGALRTEVRGEVGGRAVRRVYAAAGRIGIGTGIPAAIGAMLLAIRKIDQPGVQPPEACIEPEWFLAALDQRHIASIEEQVLDWEREPVAGARR